MSPENETRGYQPKGREFATDPKAMNAETRGLIAQAGVKPSGIVERIPILPEKLRILKSLDIRDDDHEDHRGIRPVTCWQEGEDSE